MTEKAINIDGEEITEQLFWPCDVCGERVVMGITFGPPHPDTGKKIRHTCWPCLGFPAIEELEAFARDEPQGEI